MLKLATGFVNILNLATCLVNILNLATYLVQHVFLFRLCVAAHHVWGSYFGAAILGIEPLQLETKNKDTMCYLYGHKFEVGVPGHNENEVGCGVCESLIQ